MKKLRFCDGCMEYTLEESCPKHGLTKSAYPPKFSIPDKYSEYRKKAKKF